MARAARAVRGVLKRVAHRLGRAYLRRINESEAGSQSFARHNERPAEYAFVFRQVNRCAPQTVLDVGTGTTALPALLSSCGCVVTAIDNVRDYWPAGMVNRHWLVVDCDITKSSQLGPFDMVTCISVLEHIADHRSAVRNMMAMLRPGGHLVLAGPYTNDEYVEDCYRAPGADPAHRDLPYICRSYSRAELEGWLEQGDGELVESEYWRTWTGRHWSLGERIAPPRPAAQDGPHTHACSLIRRRTPVAAQPQISSTEPSSTTRFEGMRK